MLFHLLFISMTKSVYNDFKATIQKYTIQINIKMKIKISIKYVFLDIVRPITHQAVQKSSKHICCTACCVIIGPTICKNKRSMLKSARYLDYYPFDYMQLFISIMSIFVYCNSSFSQVFNDIQSKIKPSPLISADLMILFFDLGTSLFLFFVDGHGVLSLLMLDLVNGYFVS